MRDLQSFRELIVSSLVDAAKDGNDSKRGIEICSIATDEKGRLNILVNGAGPDAHVVQMQLLVKP